MDIASKLSALGFIEASVLNAEQGLTRIRTNKGWVYQRFSSDEEIAAWARNRRPETT